MSNKPIYARNSTGDPYLCAYSWPDNCFVQCGDSGVVMARSSSGLFDNPAETVSQVLGIIPLPPGAYRTAFFEAFPRNPNTFIRGEGATIRDAEQSAWEKFTRYAGCSHPQFEKRSYTNGMGFCVDCGMSSARKFAPWEKCSHCGYPVYPGDVCYHCHLFAETQIDEDSLLADFIADSRQAAHALVARDGFFCPDCMMSISKMRFVDSDDFRLSEAERERQSAAYTQALIGRSSLPGGLKFDRKLTFCYSVFFECGCDRLKLIADLAEKRG